MFLNRPAQENGDKSGQGGFTLLEILLAVAIMGLAIPLIVASVRVIVVQTDNDITRVRALAPLESAVRRLGEDIPLAQATDLVGASSTLVLYWIDWSDESQYDTSLESGATYNRFRVTYSLNGTDLDRQFSTCDDWNLTTSACDGTWTSTVITLGDTVTSLLFTRNGNRVTIDMTASPKGTGFPEEDRSVDIFGALLSSEDPV